MAFVPPLIPVVIAGSKIYRNSVDEEPTTLAAHETRKKSIVNRLCSGPGAPISHWSQQHLDRMIKTNNVMQEFEDGLRRCHAETRNQATGGDRPQEVLVQLSAVVRGCCGISFRSLNFSCCFYFKV